MTVSVLMITYNHERWLAEAIEGVVGQQADFPFELLIGEDCSTDGTRDIALEYEAKYPDLVRVLPHSKNLGANANMARCYGEAQGDFVALCEGDDKWIAKDKLQRQVNYLRQHPECSVCFHNVLPFQQDSEEWPILDPTLDGDKFELADLLRGNFIHTCSAMYRRRTDFRFPDWYSEITIGDIPLHAFHAELGSIGYLPRVMAAYRMHSGGTYSTIGLIEKCAQGEEMIDKLDEYFGYRFHREVELCKARFSDLLAEEKITRGLQAA